MLDNNNKREISKLIDIAEKMRQAHYSLAQLYLLKARIIHALVLVLSCLVAILIFADLNIFLIIAPYLTIDHFKLFVGTIASVVFILSVLEEYTRFHEQSRIHEEAGKKLTTFIRNGNSIIKQQQDITIEQINEIRTTYQIITDVIPCLPDKVFLKEKQKYLIKVAISKQLDINPFRSLCCIKKEIAKHQKVTKNE